MTQKNHQGKDERMIHIRLPADVHKRLRVRCLLHNTSMQDYVTSLIISDINDLDMSELEEGLSRE